MKRAVFVTATWRHYTAILPVIQEAKNNGWKTVVFRFEKFFDKFDVSKFTMRPSLESFYTRKVQRERGIPFLCYNMLAKAISKLIKILGLKWNVVLVESDRVLPCKIAVLVAKHARIPSLLLLHQGVIGYNYSCFGFLVDKIVAMSPFAREILLSCGVQESEIVVTGRPVYDILVRQRFNRRRICRKFGLDPDKKIILYTTENIGAFQTRKTIYAICRAIRELVIHFQSSKQWSKVPQFFVKVHPEEVDIDTYKDIISEVRVGALVSRTGDIYEILSICDILITGFSTTALDAMILGKPVITINLTKMKNPVPFAESGAAIGVYDEKNLAKAIEDALYNENVKRKMRQAQKQFIYEHAYKVDGKSSKRVVEIMEQMAQRW